MRAFEKLTSLLRRRRAPAVEAASDGVPGGGPGEPERSDGDPTPGVPEAVRDGSVEADMAVERYLRTGDLAALDRATACWERVLSHPALTATTLQVRLATWNRAARAFVQRYQARGTPGDLDRALALCARAVAGAPPDLPARAKYLNNLGNGLHLRYERAGRIEDLQDAIAAWRQAVAAMTPTAPDRATFLTNLGRGLQARYRQTGRIEDLEQAIDAYQEAVATSPPDSQDRPAFLTNLGNGLAARHDRTGRPEDLEAAIQVYRQAVALTAPDAPHRPRRLTNLGSSLKAWYRRTGRIEDLEEAIEVCRQAVTAVAPDSPERPALLNNLAGAFYIRYERTEQAEDLQNAIHAYRKAAAAIPPGSPERPVFLNNLGTSLHTRYERTGRLPDLEEAIDARRQAVAVTAPGSPSRPKRLTNLAESLRIRHERTGRREDIEEAIDIDRQAAAATPPDSPDRAMCLANLALCLHTRHQQTGRIEDIEEAIDICRQASAFASPESSDWPSVRRSLGVGLVIRYERTGQMEDLEEAIDLYRQAVAANPPGSPDSPALLSNLGNSLVMRHRRTGRMEDLWEAIGVSRQAVAASSPRSPRRPAFLNNLSVSLRTRYERTGRTEDLDEAIDVSRQAVAATSPEAPIRPALLNSLAADLFSRHEQTGRMEDLQDAIRTSREAVAVTAADSSHRPKHLNTLGTCVFRRHALTGRVEDLQDAIDTWRQAIASAPPDSPDRPMLLNNLGNGLRARHGRTGQAKDLREVMATYRQAVEAGRVLAPEIALGAALNWVDWALQRDAGQEASQAVDEAMAIVDRLYEEQLLRSDKQSWLRMAQALYARAAYCRARLGDLPGAALALETGRARVLTETLDRNRAALERLEAEAPAMCARYREALARLRGLEAVAATQTHHRHPGLSEEIRQVRGDLHAAVDRIRGIAGYESFLAAPTVATLERDLAPGVPVVYLATTRSGGLALAVVRASGGMTVTPLWLDALTESAVRSMLFGRASAREGEPDVGGWLGAYLAWRQQPDSAQMTAHWHDAVTRTTRSLWDLVVGPVVDLLRGAGGHDQGSPAQAVLIPGGLLALLPLHAAWTDAPDSAHAAGTRWAVDAVAFRYAPSLRALAHARAVAGHYVEQAGGPRVPVRLLAVHDPAPTAAPRLPHSEHEVDAAAAQFEPDHVTLLAQERCRRAEVLAAIAGADVCHFSYHGANHWRNPLQSGLVMAGDELLTVEDLLALSSQRSRLAVLSACETGLVGTDVPDEVVALPAAFVQAGFAGVVASLWSVYDVSTSLLMARFYELWRKDLLAPAVALQRAQIWLRELTNDALVSHLEGLVPDLVPRMPFEEAAALHFRALVQDPSARPFAHPVHWAAFYFTGE